MTTHRLRVDHRATAEFDAAVDWYDSQRRGLGDELIDEVDSAILRILEQPDAGFVVPGFEGSPNVRHILVRKFPYAVVYCRLEDEILIVAIAHGHRKPGYWRDRIGP